MTPQIGEHVGLALQAALECPVSINILPPAVRRKKVIAQYSLVAILSAVCLCAPLGAWGIHLKRGAQIASEKATGLNKEIDEAKKWDKEIRITRENIQRTLKLSEPLERSASDRRYWVTLLETLHSCLPQELVWVTNLELIKPATVGAPGIAGATQKASAPQPAQPPGSVRMIVKGFYLENPKGVEVVDEFGMALRYKSAFDNALTERNKTGSPATSEEVAALRTEEIQKIKLECERARWDAPTTDKFCERLKTVTFPDYPVKFTVAPIQDWVRPNTPSPTDWAQEFVIPLDLLNPPTNSSALNQ